MAYNEIRNGMKGTPMSLEQRATANKMNMLNKRPSPLEQAMIPKGNFEPIAPPKGIFEPPVKPRMDMVGEIRKKQIPDMESPYMLPKKPMAMAPKGDILTSPVEMPPPFKQQTSAPIAQPMIQSDVVTAPKGGVSPPPVALPPPPLQQMNTPAVQPVIQSDVVNVPQEQGPKIDVTPPPMGGSALPPPPIGGGITPPVKPPVGGGITPPPEIQHSVTSPTVPAAQPSTPSQQAWQDSTVAASTSSFQNPYDQNNQAMLNPLQYLRGQGVNIGDEYGKYFTQYDTASEDAAKLQYGFGQDASIASARSNLMQMTQQGLGSGFGGVGFGGAGASGVRSQFGLGAQQAGLSLRGDIYGMRRDQEEDWWNTLAGVESRRGEMFGENPIAGNVSTSTQAGAYTGGVNPTTSSVSVTGFEQSSGPAITGSPSNPVDGQSWTNNNGVNMKWSESSGIWMPEEQWGYYNQRGA